MTYEKRCGLCSPLNTLPSFFEFRTSGIIFTISIGRHRLYITYIYYRLNRFCLFYIFHFICFQFSLSFQINGGISSILYIFLFVTISQINPIKDYNRKLFFLISLTTKKCNLICKQQIRFRSIAHIPMIVFNGQLKTYPEEPVYPLWANTRRISGRTDSTRYSSLIAGIILFSRFLYGSSI